MRHASQVAEQMQAVVPDEYKSSYDWHIKNASYKPPEQQRECFVLLSAHCNELVTNEHPLVTDWKMKISDILMDKV